jgi:hypothetical protein
MRFWQQRSEEKILDQLESKTVGEWVFSEQYAIKIFLLLINVLEQQCGKSQLKIS